MFGKSKSMKSLVDSSAMETVIGPDTVVQGTLSSKGSIRIDGKLEGGVSDAATVVIGEGGEISGDINSNAVVVGGKVIGNIVAASAIEMLSNAQIHGDLKTGALSIAEGATFEGNCIMTKEKQVIEMDVSAAGIKGRR